MRKKFIPICIIACLMLSAAGCGEKSPEMPTENSDKPSQTESSQTSEKSESKPLSKAEQSENISESSADISTESSNQENEINVSPLTFGGDGTLKGFKEWMQTTHPEAIAGISYIGHLVDYTGGNPFWESLEDASEFPPFLLEYMPGSKNFALINDPDSIETNDKILWCIVPSDDATEIIFHTHRVSAEAGERDFIRDVKITPAGKPVLFYWNVTCHPVPTLSITVKNNKDSVTFDLEQNNRIPPDPDVPMGDLILPENIFDFEVKDTTPVSQWMIAGRWTCWTDDTENRLWLHNDGTVSWWIRNRDGKLLCLNEGIWSVNTDGTVHMDYRDTLNQGSTGTSIDLYYSEKNLINDERELHFINHLHFPHTDGDWDIAKRALDIYESKNGTRPTDAKVIIYTQGGPVVHVWDKQLNGNISRAWYLMDIFGTEATDIITGETLRD